MSNMNMTTTEQTNSFRYHRPAYMSAENYLQQAKTLNWQSFREVKNSPDGRFFTYSTAGLIELHKALRKTQWGGSSYAEGDKFSRYFRKVTLMYRLLPRKILSPETRMADYNELKSMNARLHSFFTKLPNTQAELTALTAYAEQSASKGKALMNDVLSIIAIKNKAGSNIEDKLKTLEKAARLGSSRAFYNLGVCYTKGHTVGGIKDETTAARFIGQAVLIHPQFEIAVRELKRLAIYKGNAEAYYQLALMYKRVKNVVTVDTDKAFKMRVNILNYLAKAADQGHKNALCEAGIFYLKLSKKNKQMSMTFKKFAFATFQQGVKKHDDLRAHYYLGLCYKNGWTNTGIKDLVKAAHHFEKARTCDKFKNDAILLKFLNQSAESRNA